MALHRGNDDLVLPEFTMIYSQGGGQFRAVLLKSDPDGQFLWGERIGGSTYDHWVCAVKVFPDQTVELGGNFEHDRTFDQTYFPYTDMDSYRALFLAGYNANAVVQDVFVARQQNDRRVNAINTDEAGNLYIAGNFEDTLTIGDLPQLDVPNGSFYLARSGDFSTRVDVQNNDADALVFPDPNSGIVSISSPFPFDRIRIVDALIPIRSTDPPDLLAPRKVGTMTLFPHYFSEEVVP